MSVGEQPQAVVEQRPAPSVVLGMFPQPVLDVGESGADSVLVPLERGQVDGIGEVRGEQLVALGFQARPVRGEVGELLIASRAALVERGRPPAPESTPTNKHMRNMQLMTRPDPASPPTE